MKFSSHPLIKIVTQHDNMNSGALFALSGMSKPIYKDELKKLINEGHLLDDGEKLNPRCLTIRVNDKQSGRFIKEIDINYISKSDLDKILIYNEDDEAFINGVLLTEQQGRYFEIYNGLTFDYSRSSYRLYVRYANLNYNPLVGLAGYSDAKIPIIHLDSYPLLSKGLELCVKNHFVQEFDWNYFQNPAEALQFITDEFHANRYIHFIITDIRLPLWDGCKFVKMVRSIEEKYNYRKTPIIALTMHPETSPVMVKAKEENLFAAHFTKDMEIEVLNNYLNTLPQLG